VEASTFQDISIKEKSLEVPYHMSGFGGHGSCHIFCNC